MRPGRGVGDQLSRNLNRSVMFMTSAQRNYQLTCTWGITQNFIVSILLRTLNIFLLKSLSTLRRSMVIPLVLQQCKPMVKSLPRQKPFNDESRTKWLTEKVTKSNWSSSLNCCKSRDVKIAVWKLQQTATDWQYSLEKVKHSIRSQPRDKFRTRAKTYTCKPNGRRWVYFHSTKCYTQRSRLEVQPPTTEKVPLSHTFY